jgi:Cu+-exporting ATPase
MKDPVCGMTVDAKAPGGQSEYEGTTFSFCNAGCKAKFDKNPAQYTGKNEGKKEHSCCS